MTERSEVKAPMCDREPVPPRSEAALIAPRDARDCPSPIKMQSGLLSA